MNTSILEQLYNGVIAPYHDSETQLEALKKQNGLAHGAYDDFSQKLDANLQIEFEKVMDEHIQLLPLEMTQSFINGFKLGVNLMIETIYQPPKITE